MFKKIKRLFDPGVEQSEADIKRKQLLLKVAVPIVLGSLALVLFAGVERVSPDEKKPKGLRKQVLGDFIDDRDVWASRMETQLKKMNEIAASLLKREALTKERLKTVEVALLSTAKEKKKPGDAPLQEMKAATFGTSSIADSCLEGDCHKTDFSGFGQAPVAQEGVVTPQKSFPKIFHLSSPSTFSSTNVRDYVPAGTYAKAVLTSRLTVSTAVSTQGSPQPIFIRLADTGNLPRGWTSDLKDAAVIGSCYGDLNSERAFCRIHTLTLMKNNGDAVEKSVSGWVVGEDGGIGLRGVVVDPAGKVIRRAFVAGILSGMSNFFKSSTQSSVFPVSPFGQTNAMKGPDVLKSGAAQGASNALDKLAEYSIKRAEAMSPVLIINAGRVVDVVFKKGFSLKNKNNPTTHQIKTSENIGDFNG